MLVEGSYLLGSGGWQACIHAPSSSWIIPFMWGKGKTTGNASTFPLWPVFLTFTHHLEKLAIVFAVHSSRAGFLFTIHLTQRHRCFLGLAPIGLRVYSSSGLCRELISLFPLWDCEMFRWFSLWDWLLLFPWLVVAVSTYIVLVVFSLMLRSGCRLPLIYFGHDRDKNDSGIYFPLSKL